MLLETIIAIIIGVIAGCFTGLVPGVHTNLVAVLLASYGFGSVNFLIVFIISMSITHSFISVIPGIYLGAPEGAVSLAVLPGHKMLLEGLGFFAVNLTLIGSVLGLFLCFFLYPLLKLLISFSYDFFSNNISLLLFIIGVFLVFRTKTWKQNLFVYFMSSIIGLLVLNSKTSDPLFAMLSGFFGISTLTFSLNQKNSSIPKQRNEEFFYKVDFKSLGLGSFSGFLTSILPGLGSSSAAAISSLFKSENDTKDFLFMIGSISTVNFFMSIAALSVIEKARNGSIVAIVSITQTYNFGLMIAVSLISAGLSLYLSKYLVKLFQQYVVKINYKKLVLSIIFFITIICYLLCGFIGIIIMITCFGVGLYCNNLGLPRNLMMSCIMIPVAFFFIF